MSILLFFFAQRSISLREIASFDCFVSRDVLYQLKDIFSTAVQLYDIIITLKSLQ